ncbi:MAG: dynamin family protein [Gloeocapsa sp. UFS-A4-WI-NPMV-4B04]|jgi:GTPase Era involved in 16S rRNA processing|nr:dynamin family protein [Gloeocapsa sp. UFS-A4-WI-NPMV-4B04]
MSSEQFQAAHDSIYSTGIRLVQYLHEIGEGRRSEGNDSQGLHSIEDDLNNALKALQEQKYQVAVIAAMKAGKSTFLNALIGADILPSEVKSCTVCRTDVRHIEAGQKPRLLEYREGQRRAVVVAEGDAGEIRQKFLDHTHYIRANANPDNTIRFELEHPIEAISTLSSLNGFTLVDTPGPNEWESANFDTTALKRTALEALRTCNAIVFVLNYVSYRDNVFSVFIRELTENRGDFLKQNTGKIYFILNKVDQKADKDQDIDDVIKSLQQELVNFGFVNPIIYPASARQGLLAKLIKQGIADESQIKDFKRFFSAKYAKEDEQGNQITPAPKIIAPQALEDSGTITIENTVIQAIIHNSGWNLLSDVLAKMSKAAKAIEDTLNTRLSGWEIEIETLKQKVDEYKIRSESAQKKVNNLKTSVEEQKQTLIKGFSGGISAFAEGAKTKIEDEITQIAESRASKHRKPKVKQKPIEVVSNNNNEFNLWTMFGGIGANLLELIPIVGKALAESFKIASSLMDALLSATPEPFSNPEPEQDENLDPYIIRVKTRKEAEKIGRTINDFCAPHIQSWWIDTQDSLVREGTRIREELVQKIQEDIQQISDELSNYLGEALQVELNINPIQFPSFDFPGIDARIQYQQQVFTRSHKGKRTRSRCCDSDQVYYVDVPVQEQRSIYEVDLRKTSEAIKLNIDKQISRNKELLQRVIEKQVSDDFKNAEKQINDYIKRFQDEFDSLLKERETREAETDQIRAILEEKKAQLNEYLSELASMRDSLNSWKPVQTVR